MTLDEVASLLAWSSHESSGALPLSEATFSLYPEIEANMDKLSKLDYQESINLIKKLIKCKYDKSIIEFDNKSIINHYQNVWNKYNDAYSKLLSEFFHVSINETVDASIGLIPVCPRSIQDLSFCLYNTTDDDLVETCMHECCHFYFFELCKKIFGNLNDEDYDNPSLLWYLSEISIDAILNRSEFQKLFKHNFKTYDIFYKVIINNECIVNTIGKIFDNNDVVDAIKSGLKYLEDNREELMKQIDE